jgi:TonB family protein
MFLLMSCAIQTQKCTAVPVLLEYQLFYPDHALELGLEGVVVLHIVISEQGRVMSAHVHTTSGYPLLDSAAVKTARSFVFSPGQLDDSPVRSSVLVPVEFRLKMADLDAWLMQVLVIQHKIEREYSKEQVEKLYNLYKQLIFSTRREHKIEMNPYVKDAVLESTQEIWRGYWEKYPAAILLYFDIILRYPDSFQSLRACADLKQFIDEETVTIRHHLPKPESDTLLARFDACIKRLGY